MPSYVFERAAEAPGRQVKSLYGEKELDINLGVRKIRVIKLLL